MYSDNEVLRWEKLYENFGNLSTVSKIYYQECNKEVSQNTIKRRLKQLIGYKFDLWYKKYKLMGKYSWKDAAYWKDLYEKLHSYEAVEDYLKEHNDPNNPISQIIQDYVKKFITQVLEENYDEWLKKYHKTFPYKYSEKDYLHWKEIYEKFGSLKAIRTEIQYKNRKLPPSEKTIRNGLRKIIGNKYEVWKSKFSKKPFPLEEIKKWKRLYEKDGSIGRVSELTNHDPKVLKKNLRYLIGKNYEVWYRKYYIHHSRKYSDNEIEDWISLFEELGSFSAISYKIKSNLRKIINPNVIRKNVKKYLKYKGINIKDWLEKYSLSGKIVNIGKKIHQIIEYNFMLNFKNSKETHVFYEIIPSMSLDALFRVDNSIISQNQIKWDILETYKIPKTIKIINIDYLFSTNLERIYPKMYKKYHNKKMLLLIVVLPAKVKSYSIPLDVPYMENIKVIGVEDFFKIFIFNNSLENKIRYAIEIAGKAPYSLKTYDSLIKLAKSANKQLKLQFGNRKSQQNRFNIKIKNMLKESS